MMMKRVISNSSTSLQPCSKWMTSSSVTRCPLFIRSPITSSIKTMTTSSTKNNMKTMSSINKTSLTTGINSSRNLINQQNYLSSRLSFVRSYSEGYAPLTVQQIEDRIMELLRNFDKVNKDKLTLDSHFVNDLGLDSLDQVEITMELEDEFGIEISDKDAEQIYTVRQAVETIYANKNAM